MKAHASKQRIAAMGILIAISLPVSTSYAQFGDALKQGGTEGSSGGMGELGSALSGQSMTSGSMGNVAGLLEFCVKNNYLSGGSASSVQSSLMGKLGHSPTSDSGYTSGAKGILSSSDGKQMDLSGGGMKEQITKQVCDKVLAQGKSML